MIRPTSECGEWASIWDPCGHDRVGAFQGASPPNSTARAGFWVGICLLSRSACCLHFPWVTHLEVPPVIATTFFKQTNKAPRGFHRDASECRVTPAFHDWLRPNLPVLFLQNTQGRLCVTFWCWAANGFPALPLCLCLGAVSVFFYL